MKNELNELDIIHNPYQLPTVFNFKQKYIISVLDLIQILFPKEIKKSVYISQKIMLSKSIKSADKIISISHHTKNDIIKHFKIPEDKIKVIYEAANENYKPLKEDEINKIKEILKNPKEFIYLEAYAGITGDEKKKIKLLF